LTALFIYDYFYPAYKAGGPIQSLLNLSNHLGSALEVKVICSNTDHDGTILQVVKDEWTETNKRQVYYSSKGFNGIKRNLLQRDCVCFINGLYSIHYNLLPALFFRGRKIVSVRGMLHPGGLAQKRLKKIAYLFLWKVLGLHRRCEYHATNLAEKEFIQKVFGSKARVWVIPNLPNILSYQKLVHKRAGHIKLCSVALISPMKNHLLVLQALKLCTQHVIYDIYGPVKDTAYWERCKEVIAGLSPNIMVNYHGEVPPAMIPEVLGRSHVFIQPSASENFGHSIFEAFTAGLPVITSENTPWNDLRKDNAGLNVSLDGPEDISAAIAFFADMDEVTFEKWSLSARAYALKAVDIDKIKSEYLKMFAAA
jgi:glycosyltransferase involved in cell wall biosynthesis